MAALSAGVLTVSDRVSSGHAEDRSGPTAVQILGELGFESRPTSGAGRDRAGAGRLAKSGFLEMLP